MRGGKRGGGGGGEGGETFDKRFSALLISPLPEHIFRKQCTFEDLEGIGRQLLLVHYMSGCVQGA